MDELANEHYNDELYQVINPRFPSRNGVPDKANALDETFYDSFDSDDDFQETRGAVKFCPIC